MFLDLVPHPQFSTEKNNQDLHAAVAILNMGSKVWPQYWSLHRNVIGNRQSSQVSSLGKYLMAYKNNRYMTVHFQFSVLILLAISLMTPDVDIGIIVHS